MLYGSGKFFFGAGSLPQTTEVPQFYGADVFNEALATPHELTAYQNVDGNVVLYWGLEPCSPVLDDFEWTVETDTVQTFDSVDYRSYSSVANPDFIPGFTHKGLVVPTYRREQGLVKRMYWRVTGTYIGNDTNTVTSFYDIPQAVDQVSRQAMLDGLVDEIYKKDFADGEFQEQAIVFSDELVAGNIFGLTVNDVALTPTAFAVDNDSTLAAIAVKIAAIAGVLSAVVESGGPLTNDDRRIIVRASAKDQPVLLADPTLSGTGVQSRIEVILLNSTNVNRLFNALGTELDEANMGFVFDNFDIFAEFVRDQSLKPNFGILLQVDQPANMKTIDFREICRSLLREAGNTPSLAATKRVLHTMFCADPDFILIRDTMGMYVSDDLSVPPVEPFYVDDPLSLPPVDPETIWDDHNLASGVIININNPTGAPISEDFVRLVVNKLVPTHTSIYITGL
jgi:hypothetical protein